VVFDVAFERHKYELEVIRRQQQQHHLKKRKTQSFNFAIFGGYLNMKSKSNSKSQKEEEN
jgi:hypothetical protein